MSLIERALEAPRRLAAHDEPGEERGARGPASFALDYPFLARQGFFTPSDGPQRLGLELRAVKRRLLRRLDFEAGGRRRRAGTSAGGVARARRRNVVLTTSTRPAEGKTFTAINLALSLAVEDGIGVVLIDADVPRPKITSHFGLPPGPGLADLVASGGDLELSDVLLHARDVPLALLPEGGRPGSGAAPFGREEAGRVIRAVSSRYPDRLIIIDAPPVLATSDAAILARHVDEVCFVVEANGTPEPAVATALDELLDVTDRLSIVLNKCLVAETAIHYGSYEEYYHKQARAGRRGG